MTCKTLTLGLVAALLMIEGGQASAASCPSSDTVLDFLSDFPRGCTLPGKDFTAFAFSPFSQGDLIEFSSNGPVDTVTLAAPPGGLLPHGVEFGYSITTTGTNTIVVGAGRTRGSSDYGSYIQMTTLGERFLVLLQGDAETVLFSEPAGAVTHLGALNVARGTPSSISDIFTQSSRAALPEPITLSLFGVGLAGLALARRRRS